MSALLAALLAGAAAAFATRPSSRAGLPAARTFASRWVAPAALLALAGLPAHWLASWLVPCVMLSGTGAVGWMLWQRRRAQAAREAVERQVLELCEELAGDLTAGQPPGAALSRAARSWPEVAPAAEAFRVGADVPSALRAVADRPGASELRLLAAAWQVAHRTGQGLAASVDRVAGQLVADRATRRVVEGELASARATARLVAVLPVAALAMGSGVGGDPVAFLLTTRPGWVCLGLGLALGLAGLGWIEAIATDVHRGR